MKTRGAGSKEIETDLLEGELGNVTTTKPGLRLYSEAQGKLGEFAEFDCAGGGILIGVAKSVIGYFTGDNNLTPPTNVIGTSLKLIYKEVANHQQYTSLLPPATAGVAQLENAYSGPPYVENANLVSALTIKSVPPDNLGVTK